MRKRIVFDGNPHLSMGAVSLAIVGIMLVALAPPLLPFVILAVWGAQKRFRGGTRREMEAEIQRRRENLKREKILAIKSLPKVD